MKKIRDESHSQRILFRGLFGNQSPKKEEGFYSLGFLGIPRGFLEDSWGVLGDSLRFLGIPGGFLGDSSGIPREKRSALLGLHESLLLLAGRFHLGVRGVVGAVAEFHGGPAVRPPLRTQTEAREELGWSPSPQFLPGKAGKITGKTGKTGPEAPTRSSV